MQLRVTRSTLGNNSIVTLHDGEANPFVPAVGVFFGAQGLRCTLDDADCCIFAQVSAPGRVLFRYQVAASPNHDM